ncbi:MAG: ABC transporter permease [Acidobacteriota bacterium]
MNRLRAATIYRNLLRLYPRKFRARYAHEMELSFLDLLEQQKGLMGWPGWWLVWLGALADLLSQSTAQRLRSLGRKMTHHRKPSVAPERKERMETFFSDLRFAVRTLLRRPVFTLTAVITLALGIGANSTIFSVVNGLLLRPFPYADSDRLVRIWSENPSRGWSRTDVSMSDAWEWRRRTSSFEDLAVWDRKSYNWTGGDRPERLAASRVSTNIFDLLGVQPVLGRNFTQQDGQQASQPVAILNDGFWQQRFGARGDVLGESLILDGEVYTVVGVMPPGFDFPDIRPSLWIPIRADLLSLSHANHSNLAIARLAPGVSVEQAQQDVAQAAAQLEQEFPGSNQGFSARVVTLREDLVGPIGFQASAVLMGAVGFVLLIACANVANLLLSRSSSRRHEMAVRSALGAGRGRVVRQLLTESIVLALLGGALGVALAFAWLPLIVSSFPSNLPPLFSFAVDHRVLAFTLVLAAGTAVLFGLAPALRLTRPGASGLQEGGRSGRAQRGRLGGLLVMAEIALALVLMVGGTVLMRSVIQMWQRDLGFNPHNVLTMSITLPSAKYSGAAEILAFFDQALEKVRALPGVRSAGLMRNLPLAGSNTVGTFRIVGRQDAASGTGDGKISGRYASLSPGFLKTVQARLLTGRLVSPQDRRDSPPVVVVNQTLVKGYFGEADPLSQYLDLGGKEPALVIGVIGDLYERSLMVEPRPSVYQPATQSTSRRFAGRAGRGLDSGLIAGAGNPKGDLGRRPRPARRYCADDGGHRGHARHALPAHRRIDGSHGGDLLAAQRGGHLWGDGLQRGPAKG